MIDKLEVEFKENINNKNLDERKYTLTHCDDTGQRYLFVRDTFAEEEYCKLRDEVIGQWINSNKKELRIMCTLYSKHSSYTEEQRYKIFKRHMPRAITAIVNGDRAYILENNLLNYNINVHYLSNTMYRKEVWGKVDNYIKY